MKLTLKDTQGNSIGEVEVGFVLVSDGRGTQAVHDAVVAHRANCRTGTACTKTMGEVAGSGKKPWRQKGTGRARAGSTRSPLWPGGGVVFGPKPRDYAKKVNRSTKTLALRKALSERLKMGDILVIEDIKMSSYKTKVFAAVLRTLELSGTTLIVHEGSDTKLVRAVRNLPKVQLTTGSQLHTYQVLEPDKLLFTRQALEQVGQRLK